MRKGKRVAIVQSCYIPWRGYFDLIRRVDEFILYDNAQYTKRDWRNRNRIKTAKGAQWLTIPVHTKHKFSQRICDTVVSDASWGENHWKALQTNYGPAPFFKELRPSLEELFLKTNETKLSQINFLFLRWICDYLGISTKLSWSMDYERRPGKTENLIGLCRQAGAKQYLSGPKAKGYIDSALFEQAGIDLLWMDYSGYPPYSQLYPPFEPNVTVLDLLFIEGKNSLNYLARGVETKS